MYHLGRRIREKLAGSTRRARPADPRPDLGLPDRGRARGARAPRRCCARSTASTPTGRALDGYTELQARRLDRLRLLDLLRLLRRTASTRPARRRPGREQTWVAPEWGWAWPMNRRILYNRASADPDGRPWSERKRYVWWDERASGSWTGEDVPDFKADKAPDYVPPTDDAEAEMALRGDEPFIMQADGRGWLFAPPGWSTGRCPTHYEPHESPFDNPLYGQQREPGREQFRAPRQPVQPDRRRARRRRLPVRGDHLPADRAPHRRRDVAHAPVPGRAAARDVLRGQPRAGAPSAASSTAAGRRSSPRARRSRRGCWSPSGSSRCRSRAAPSTRSACPTTGATAGSAPATPPTTCSRIALDPNVHIQEVKAATCDIVPGRRPRGPALPELVAGYRRAGRIGRRGMSGDDVELGDRAARRPGARTRAAGRLLHRHERLHRLQGVRGRLQGVERACPDDRSGSPASPTTTPASWAPTAGATSRSSSSVEVGGVSSAAPDSWVEEAPAGAASSRASSARRRRRLPLADELRRLQALHRGRLPRRVPDRRALPHRVRHGGRAGGHLQRLRLLRRRLPVRRARPARATTAASGSARSATTGSRTTWSRPARRRARPSRSSSAPLDELRERAAERRRAAARARASASARLYGADAGDGVGGFGAFFLLLDEPEVYGLPPDPVVPTRHLGRGLGARPGVAAAGARRAASSAAFVGGRA